jgi:hypothetical protein
MLETLFQKLKYKPDYSALVLNSPANFLSKKDEVDIRIAAKKKYNLVLLFVKSEAEVNQYAPKILKVLDEESIFWIAYPKKTSGIKTDVSRDLGWDKIVASGYEIVSLIAIDDTWSALRFRPSQKVKSVKNKRSVNDKKIFKAVLEKPDDGMDTAFIRIPFQVYEVYGTKGQVKVKATFDGEPYRGVLANMGMDYHVIIVKKEIRKIIDKNVGDTISVTLMRDEEERKVEVPDDLKNALSKSAKATEFFNSLSYTNMKEYALWVSSAKKTETRQKRISDSIQKLLKGLKSPSQKN